jgi:hypothetical protein
MVFVSVTRLHVRSWRFFLSFIWHANHSAHQARRAPGNLRVVLNRDSQAPIGRSRCGRTNPRCELSC